MFIKVKRFQHLESLLLEAKAIELTTQFDAALADFTKNAAAPDYTKFDNLIVSMLDLQIENHQAFINKFGEDRAANLITGYLGYCDSRLKALTTKIVTEYQSSVPDLEEIKNNQELLGVMNTRIGKLTAIYDELKIRNYNTQTIAGITQKIQAVTKTVVDSMNSILDGIGTTVKKGQIDMAAAVTDEEKLRFANLTFNKFNTLVLYSKALPAQYQQGINSAKAEADRNIENATGMDSNQLSQVIALTGEIKLRIAKLQMTNWKTVEELELEYEQIKSQINSLKGTGAEPNIEIYNEQLESDANIIREKLKDKSLDVDKTKGIHFDFNIKLRLYEKTVLPVTGQQIADNSKITKFKNALVSFLSFFGTAKAYDAREQAFADLGKSIHDTYAKVLNTSAKFIGKALGGKEGQLKADGISRIFIPDSKVLDKKPVAEELGAGSAPGLSVQVPGSIGSMGPITPPTATTFGSGDNFSPKKKKSKSKILGFSEYLKENKF
jgi:hypothetical protein